MNEQKEAIFRTYAWSYFAIHADQRMKTFNFFLLAAGLLAGGITTLLRDGKIPLTVAPLGLVLSALSFVFWKIDQRNCVLVRNGENAIKYLDGLNRHSKPGKIPHVLDIFERDDFNTSKAPTLPLTTGHLGYSRCLQIIFILFGALGMFFMAMGILGEGSSSHSNEKILKKGISDTPKVESAIRRKIIVVEES